MSFDGDGDSQQPEQLSRPRRHHGVGDRLSEFLGPAHSTQDDVLTGQNLFDGPQALCVEVRVEATESEQEEKPYDVGSEYFCGIRIIDMQKPRKVLRYEVSVICIIPEDVLMPGIQVAKALAPIGIVFRQRRSGLPGLEDDPGYVFLGGRCCRNSTGRTRGATRLFIADLCGEPTNALNPKHPK